MEGRTGLIFQSQNGNLSRRKDGTFTAKLRGDEPRVFATEDEARYVIPNLRQERRNAILSMKDELTGSKGASKGERTS